jgi:hypothetical protein
VRDLEGVVSFKSLSKVFGLKLLKKKSLFCERSAALVLPFSERKETFSTSSPVE